MEDLRIVRGNDFFLEVPVRNIVFIRNEETGEIIKSSYPVNLDGCEILKVHIVNDGEWKKPVPFTVNGGNLKIKVDGCIECGWYGIEVLYKLSGYKYRSYERKVFKIVENNGKNYVNGEQYEGEHSYQVDIMWTYGVLVEADLIALIRNAVHYEPGEGENSIQQVGAQATGRNSVAIGQNTLASANESYAEGDSTIASGNNAHAEGHFTEASGSSSHAEGKSTEASDGYAHSEGEDTKASGYCSHAEGKSTEASNATSHSEGVGTEASGIGAHAEGFSSEASGDGSHAGGLFSNASGAGSFVHGNGLVAENAYEAAFGMFNASHTGDTQEETTAFSVGIGTGGSDRKNAFEVMQDGTIYILLDTERVKLQDLLATLSQDISEITSGAAAGSGDAPSWTGEPIDIDPYGYPYEPVGSWDDTDNNVNP